MIYLIFVVSAVSGACVIFWLSVKIFQKNEKINVLGSVYIAEVNVLLASLWSDALCVSAAVV